LKKRRQDIGQKQRTGEIAMVQALCSTFSRLWCEPPREETPSGNFQNIQKFSVIRL
jgi:hypothetical protein